MSIAVVLLELVKQLGREAIERMRRKPVAMPARVDVKPLSTHPSMTIIDREGNRRDL